MALVDDVIIKIKAGDGGDGGRAFHTNYGSTNVHRDGGNGGDGGDIFFEGSANINDLSEFRFKKVIKAGNGIRGMNKTQNGKKGESVTVLIPLGTTITDVSNGKFTEILEKGQKEEAAIGGRGGIGNFDPLRQLSLLNKAGTTGTQGEQRELRLVLNLIADIGLVGLPNAGKSSLLKTLSNATPKIGVYPFTTLEPNLGIMHPSHMSQKKRIVIADIPGVIEGASEGRGLGIQFLKHIQKTKVLLHCVDASSSAAFETYKTVREEFKNYDSKLLEKKEIILLTKIDLLDEKQLEKQIVRFKKTKNEVIPVSIYDEASLKALAMVLQKAIK